MTQLSPGTLYSALGTICPQEYTSLPRSPTELNTYLTNTLSSAHLALSSIPLHPSAPVPIQHETNLQLLCNLWKPHNISSNPPPPGQMKVWKLSAKDGKGTWFARRSVHKGIEFARFKRGLEAELSLEKNGLHGLETQAVPGGKVESVRGIGLVEKLGETIHEAETIKGDEGCVGCTEGGQGSGEMECARLAAQFPGPTAAREFVVCSVKKSNHRRTDTDLSNDTIKGRQFTVVSRPVVGCEEVYPVREGYIRGQFESVEFIREVVPEQDESVTEECIDSEGDSGVERKRVEGSSTAGGERLEDTVEETMVEEDALPGCKLAVVTPMLNSDPGTPLKSGYRCGTKHPIEWVMISRSDPGGNVPRWVVERGTPGGILKDAEKFLTWLAGLSDEDLGLHMWGKEKQRVENEELMSSALEAAGEAASSLAPVKLLQTAINGRIGPRGSSIPQPTPSERPSSDSISVRSFSTALQQQASESPPHSPPSTSTTCEELSSTESHSLSPSFSALATGLPLPNDGYNSANTLGTPTGVKTLSRLISQKSYLLSQLEKALAKNRRGEGGEEKLRAKYESDVGKAEERYKRAMERMCRRQEREAVKAKRKLEWEKEKRETRETKRTGPRVYHETVEAARIVVEKLTGENEMLMRENEELRAEVRGLLEAQSQSQSQSQSTEQ